jgi:hypothetical protein
MMVRCNRCGLTYSHLRSTSALTLTYCCMLCEVADLGYSLAAFEKAPLPEHSGERPIIIFPAMSAVSPGPRAA